MSTEGMTELLADGRPHAMPCPAERHGGEDHPLLYVRYLTTDDLWLLHCWGRPPCSYAEIVRLLHIDTNPTQTIRRGGQVRHLVAAYGHADPGEAPRMVFHSWRDDADDSPPRQSRGREMGYRGGVNGAHLMVWAPDEGNAHDTTTLVVVGSEDEAISLMRAGVYQDGYVPVSWYRAVSRLEEDRQSVDRVDWSHVHGRRVAFWPARTPDAYSEMLRAAGMATVAGATRLLMVDPQGSELGEGADAASLTDPDEIKAVLHRMRVLPMPHGDAGSDAPPECEQEGQSGLETDADNDTSDIERILHLGVETATDVSMAIRVLREHGSKMVLASSQEGSESAVAVYWRTGTGELEKRPAGLGLALWESRVRYVEALRAALTAGDLSSEDYKVCITHANRTASPAGLCAVAASLGIAIAVLERLSAVPDGLRRINAPDIDVETHHLDAPNASIEPDTGNLPSRTGGRPRTEADVWLLDAIEITGDPSDKLASSALWEAARSAVGSVEDQNERWGLTRRALTTRAIHLHGLPRPRSVRIEGQVFTGWNGVRLAADRDVAGN